LRGCADQSVVKARLRARASQSGAKVRVPAQRIQRAAKGPVLGHANSGGPKGEAATRGPAASNRLRDRLVDDQLVPRPRRGLQKLWRGGIGFDFLAEAVDKLLEELAVA